MNSQKKTILAIVLLFSIAQTAIAQKVFNSEKFSYSFETTAKIDRYDTESDRVIGYENKDIAVDTEIFYLNEVASDYLNNLSKTTEVITSRLSLYRVKTAVRLRYVKYGYQVRATDIDGSQETPVFVVVMYNKEKGIIYESTIYCYKNNTEEGLRIAKSFKFLY